MPHVCFHAMAPMYSHGPKPSMNSHDMAWMVVNHLCTPMAWHGWSYVLPWHGMDGPKPSMNSHGMAWMVLIDIFTQ